MGGRIFLYIKEIDFGLAGAVGDVGDIFPVVGELRSALVRSRRAGDVAGDACLDRHVEDFAACRDGKAVSLVGDADCRQVAVDVHFLVTGVDAFGVKVDVDFLDGPVGGVEGVEVAAVLENDPFAVGARELDVILLEIGDLGGLSGLGVVDEDVHPVVAVRDEEDLVANPHGHDVLCVVVGDRLDGLAVVEPDLVGLTSTVILPGTELAEDAVVGKGLAVRGVAAEAAFRQRQGFAHAACRRDAPELALETVADAVAVYDILSVRSPAHNDVVGAHTVAQVVAAVGAGIGEPDRFAAGHGHRVNFGIAVILSREGDGPAVGRESGEHFVSYVRGEPFGMSAAQRSLVKVSCIGEYDVGAICGGETEEPSFVSAG